jgi:hypothetical protein
MIKLIVIKTKNKVYISDEKEDSYNKMNLSYYLFDGIKPKEGNLKRWYELDNVPTKITKKVEGECINKRYELKKGYPSSDLTPSIIPYGESEEFEEIIGLYEYKYDRKPDYYEKVEFELSIIDEQDDFKLIREDYTVAHSFMDKLKYNPVQLPYKPCAMTTEQTFKIIREYIKGNIDGRYARVSSDYDFHFEVVKNVELYEPEFYTVDVNSSLFNKRRKPKYETRRKDNRNFAILNIKDKNSSKSYGNNCVTPIPFSGNTYEDMINNMKTYLENLIKEINEPLCECPHCKGTGIQLKEENDNE